MPDDFTDWFVQRLWPDADGETRRAYRDAVLELQGGADLGGGSPSVAAAAGPGQAAGVQSPTKGGGMSERLRATEEQMHAMLRREMCASADLLHWTKAYRERPHDATGMYLHAAWLEMRAAVDALAAFDPPSFDKLSLAVSPEVA